MSSLAARLGMALGLVALGGLGGSGVGGTAHAKGKKVAARSDDAEVTDDGADATDKADGGDGSASSDEAGSDEAGSDEELDVNDRPVPKQGAKSTQTEDAFQKQDLSGHAVSTAAAKNQFEKDRFFVDKVDTRKTAKTTLIQGSLASSTFVYTERGGAISATDPLLGTSSSRFNRLFTELRLQTDFRHLGGGRWDARVDARVRAVNTPANNVDLAAGSTTATDANHIQSGFNGTNEYDIRELWLTRNGKRSDVVIGRQYVADLGAVKIDGLRLDYAKSEEVTLVAFAGLYPLRGSRSLTTDYDTLKKADLTAGGKFVSAGGFGAAYRTQNAHGGIGGVVLYPPPTSDESPRVFATSQGYYRSAAKFDLYHFGIVDLVGPAGFQLTNLSAGINYRPSARLRLNGAFNRVDTETLNVQAREFLEPAVTAGVKSGTQIQNDSLLLRIASNQARAGLSAGLGSLERFEFSASAAYRWRPSLLLTAPDTVTNVGLSAAKGVEVYVSFVDRRSIADLRIGVDFLNTRAVGNVAYQRSEVSAGRVFLGRELKSGHGEWDAEIGYAKVKDKPLGTTCPLNGTDLFGNDKCFGASAGHTLSLGGNLYYRINRDWFALGSLFLNRIALQRVVAATITTDPPVTGITGFFRIAYRF